MGAMLLGGLFGGRRPAAPAGSERPVPMTAAHVIAASARAPTTDVSDRPSRVRPMQPTHPPGDVKGEMALTENHP